MRFKIGKYINIYKYNDIGSEFNLIYSGIELKGTKLSLNKSIDIISPDLKITKYANYIKDKCIDLFIGDYWYYIEVDYDTERLLDNMNQSEIL